MNQLMLFGEVEQGANSSLGDGGGRDGKDNRDSKDGRDGSDSRDLKGAGRACVPRALCQDVSVLMGIDSYSYDLGDEGFQAYCLARGVLYVAGRPGSRLWAYFLNTALDLGYWLADEGVRFAQEVGGSRHRYSDAQMESQWRCVLIGRGKLEDAWGLYCSG